MPRKAEGPKPLTPAQRQARKRARTASQIKEMRLRLYYAEEVCRALLAEELGVARHALDAWAALDDETTARERWNGIADEYNQWDALGQDEKDALIQDEIRRRFGG